MPHVVQMLQYSPESSNQFIGGIGIVVQYHSLQGTGEVFFIISLPSQSVYTYMYTS